ncbi:MAG: XdhC/CoxI family protein [Chloroflexota bacterium]
MRDILPDLLRWRENDAEIALATVIQTWGSSPRQEGAKMGIRAGGEITGSVSGGCVESAVAEAALGVLRNGDPQILHFGVADETAWEVGLACGGSLDVLVERLDPKHFDFVRDLVEAEVPAATVTVLKGPPELVGRKLSLSTVETARRYGSLNSGLDKAVVELARQAGQSAIVELRAGDQPVQAFIDVLPPPPTLVIVGGAHISISLAQLAKTMGYRTAVVDPRRAFATEARFPGVDRLIRAWPGEAFKELPLTSFTAVVTLSHDPKIDEPALSLALPSPAFYVGALGSRTTQAKRRERLKAHGVSDADLDRLHGPVGLDLGAEVPEEIALSIMAQIVAARNSRA